MKKIDGNPMTVDFELLWGRIHKLLINALQVEDDPVNTQILLGKYCYAFLHEIISNYLNKFLTFLRRANVEYSRSWAK